MNATRSQLEISEQADSPIKSRRFLITAIGFLVYESILIGVFGDYFFAESHSAFVAWTMIGLAAAGYFVLGALSGSWLSVLLIAIPMVIAAIIDVKAPGSSGGETLDLDQQWVLLTILFLPAWALGSCVAFFRARRAATHRQ